MDLKNRLSFGRSSSVETRPLVSSLILEEHKGKPLAHSVQLWQCQRFSSLALFPPHVHILYMKIFGKESYL